MVKEVSRSSARNKRSGGGTLVGVVVGLLVGLALAVGVALYMSRSSGPFVDKGKRPDKLAEPARGDDLPDPNRGAQKVERVPPPEPPPPPPPDPTAPAEPPAAPSAVQGSPDASAPTGAAPAPVEPAVPAVPPATQAPVPAATEPAPDRSSYVLQAGAFKSQEDAEGMKVKLALIGFEARIISAEVNGVTFYRVRVGPYGQLEDMNRARGRLAENGIEASVVRQR
jgi:cell division protein FtsN